MLTIIGCGNPNRGDDGVGVVVARRLACYVDHRQAGDVRVCDAGTDGMGVMFLARGADELVLVDASKSGSEPGAIFEVPGSVLEQDYAPQFSLHDFRWDHALYAGRRIFGVDFPARVTVLLIEAQQLGLGLGLSAPVQAAADTVVARLEARIEERARAAFA
jgi:hydrogenase maturation protease